MRRKTTQVMMLSLLLAGSAAAVGNYVFAADESSSVTVPAKAAGQPYKPTNLTASVGDTHEDGTADVTLTFTTPSKYWDDWEYESADGLDELTEIAVYEVVEEDYWSTSYNLVKSVTEGLEIGAEMSVTLENQASGSHTYRVYALNSESSSRINSNYYSYAAVTVKVGYDAPGAVGDLTLVNNNPEITLTWTAPTTGKEGGTFRTESLSYDIYRYTGSNLKESEKIASSVTELTYTDKVTFDAPTQVAYGVVAKNADGEGDVTKTSGVIVGSAYSLPFSETFSGGTAQKLWSAYKSITEFSVATSISTSYGIKTGFGATLKGSYDGDGGGLYFKCNSDYYDEDEEVKDTYGTYTSASISLEGATHPTLSFYQYVVPNANNNLKTRIFVQQNGVDNEVASYTYNDAEGEEGWVARAIDLSQFAGGNIVIIFRGDCTNDTPGFTAFDDIVIEESRENDLVLNSFSADTSVDAGAEFKAKAEVFNKGSKAAENFDVELYINGELYKSETVASLASGETTTVEFTGTALNSFGENAALVAKVVFAADEDATNNDSEELTLKVKTAATPDVRDVEAKTTSDGVLISWTEPDYKLPENEKVTESFEDYSDGDKSFGSWTTSSAHSYGVDFEYYGLDEDAYTGSATFTVTNASESDWYGKAVSGDNYLMKTNNNTDWLYSPVLSGNAQTISFAIASRHQPEYYDWDEYSTIKSHDVVKVLYSTTTNDQSAFTETVVNQDINSILANGDDFETITAELPEGAKYFAIVISAPTVDGWNQELESTTIVFIDDIVLEKGQDGVQAQLEGYSIYEGEILLTETPIAETEYLVVNPTQEAEYTVYAVYNVGSSEGVTVKVEGQSGVSEIGTSAIKVYGNGGQLYIEGAQAASVYDLSGRRVAQTKGNAVLTLAPSAYVVRADNKTYKVIVK